MTPEVRKVHIEASNKGRPDQKIYGSQYFGKVPANDQKNKQRNQKMGGTTQEDNKKNDNNKKYKEKENQNHENNQFLNFNQGNKNA